MNLQQSISKLTKIILVFILSFSFSSCSIIIRTKGKYINADVPLYYYEKGKGEPVVLVHGVLVNSDLNWKLTGVIRKLSKKYRVIVFDLRGNGKSGKPHGKEHYGIRLAEDISTVMDALGIEKAHIVGYSLGGFITLKYAVIHPERCYSVVVGGAGWERLNDENIKRLKKIADAIRYDKDCKYLLAEVGMENKGLEKIIVNIVNFYYRLTNDPEAIADLMESTTALEVNEEELKNCQVPILLLGGNIDPVCKTYPELESVLPNAKIVWIKNGTHLTTLFKKEFTEQIERFISDNSVSKTN